MKYCFAQKTLFCMNNNSLFCLNKGIIVENFCGSCLPLSNRTSMYHNTVLPLKQACLL